MDSPETFRLVGIRSRLQFRLANARKLEASGSSVYDAAYVHQLERELDEVEAQITVSRYEDAL